MTNAMSCRTCFAIFVIVALTAPVMAQQVPTDPASTHVFPAGGRRGTTVAVRVGGECLSPYTRFTVLGRGVSAEPELVERATARYEPSPRRKPGETPIYYPREWKSTITVAADAPVGQALWRVSSARGGTQARPFLIGDLPEFIETESNSTPATAEPITLPVTVNGQIAGERDVDYYRFAAQEHDVVTVDVAVARLGSTLEPVVELYDAQGRRLPVEEIRVGSDPVLALRVPATGDYRLLVSSLNFRGGPQFVYRLTISKAPYIKFAFPPGGLAGTTSEIKLFALTGDGRSRSWPEIVAFPTGAPTEFALAGSAPLANAVALESSDLPVVVEAEPNEVITTATPVAGYATIYGRFSAPADEDCFTCSFAKDQAVTFECSPVPRGSGLLPVVTISTTEGASLASVSAAERSPRICRLEWRAPQAGPYVIRVKDIRQGQTGGVDAPYRLTIRPTELDFAFTASTDIANVVQGARAELELKIDRQGGFFLPIDLAVEGLPPGVRVEPAQIPAGLDVFRVAFVAEADTQPGDALLKLRGTAKSGERLITHSATAVHLGHDAEGVSFGSPTVDHVQLTVRHKPVFRLYCNEAYQYAYRGTVYPYLMEVERLGGFDGPIQLEVADRQIKDLDGVEVMDSQIPAGSSQLMLPLFLPENMHINVQAHSNIYAQGYVVFQDKWGRRQSMTQISEMRCMIRPLPTVAKLRVIEKSVALRPGSATCSFKLERTSNFDGDLRVDLYSPPAGVSMESITIPAGETAGTARLSVSEGAVFSNVNQLTFRGRGDLPGGVQVISDTVLPVQH